MGFHSNTIWRIFSGGIPRRFKRLAEIPFEVGNIELQKLGVNPRHQAVEVGGGRNQPSVAGAIGQPARLVFNAPLAFHNGKDLNPLGRAVESGRVANAQFLEGEKPAGKNESARAVLLFALEPGQIAPGRKLRANNVEPFFQVQWARFAIQAGPAKIIQPIGEIGIFLDLEKQQAGSQSVDNSRRQKHGLLRLRPEALQKVARSSAFEYRKQLLLRHAGLQPEQNRGVGVRLQEIPHLALTHVAGVVNGGVSIVGMDLHGKPVTGKDVLGEKRKTAARPGLSVQFRPVFFRSLRKGHSRRGAVQEERNIIGDPHLADALVGELSARPGGGLGAAKSGAKSRRPQIFGLKILESWRGPLKVDIIRLKNSDE